MKKPEEIAASCFCMFSKEKIVCVCVCLIRQPSMTYFNGDIKTD